MRMQYDELLAIAPSLREYAASVPDEINASFTLQSFPPYRTIHPKDSQLTRVGILLSGSFRVLNELENGNIFMIEANEPISFVGEVTLLAGTDTTSVTIETTADCLIAFLPVEKFDLWLQSDIRFLRRVSAHVAKKLYCSSYYSGERLFYSSNYLLLKYIIGEAEGLETDNASNFLLKKTRSCISEELGMSIKTLNRTISTLQSDELISLRAGKIHLTRAQYEAGKKRLTHYRRQNRNGSKIGNN